MEGVVMRGNDEKQLVSDKKAGYVYIVSSDSIRIMDDKKGDFCCPVKIGSAKDTDSRMGTLNSAVPVDFILHMRIQSPDMFAVETKCHEILKSCRCENSEFFKCSVKEAKAALRSAVREIAGISGWRRTDWSEETKIAQLGRSGAKSKALREELYAGKIKFVCRGKDVVAYGEFNGPENFIIKQGSRISLSPSPKFFESKPFGYGQKWKEVLRLGLVDSQGKVLKDIECSSRAMAASVVLASIKNGNKEWMSFEEESKPLGHFFGKEMGSRK